MKYPHIVRAFAETPWAILPAAYATILDLVEFRAAGYELSTDEIRDRVGARKPPVQTQAGDVAVLPLYGVLFPRANLMTEMSGATSLETWSATFRQLVRDPAVSAIVLDVDSPGGLVDRVLETAAEVREARKAKPILAVANTTAASAAYWIASQADEVVVTPSGEVGAIGVFSAHDDVSGLQEKMGVKTTLIWAGKYKTELSPFEPLSEEARAAEQASVDDVYGDFVEAVAKGRGVSVATVRSGFGEGRVANARNAVAEGMADRVDTLDATVARLLRGAAGHRQASDRLADESTLEQPEAVEPVTLAQPEQADEQPVPEPLLAGAERLLARAAVRDAYKGPLTNHARPKGEPR
ncbi:MAG: S49 family peptidase [Gemmatimonadota bacterium]